MSTTTAAALPDIPFTPEPADAALRPRIPPALPGADTLAADAPNLPAGPFIGRESFRCLVRQSFAAAAKGGWHELLISDADFADWPLGEPAVAAALHEWARKTSGRCIVLARNYDAVPRQHALFVRWRSQWQHKIECFECPHDMSDEVPSLLWSPHWALQRVESVRGWGISGAQARRLKLLRSGMDEWLARAVPGFPAVTLGL